MILAFDLHFVVSVTRAIHRLIEQHVALHGDEIAVVDGDRSCSYRELNSAANALARRMMNNGFHRGMCADVRMPPSLDLAVILLAVLKAGGHYVWSHADQTSLEIAAGDARAPLHVDDVQVNGVCGGPNLPVITRDTDLACVLNSATGEGSIAVPHSTIVAMASCAGRGRMSWAGEPGAFDLWATLLSGATAVVAEQPAVAA